MTGDKVDEMLDAIEAGLAEMIAGDGEAWPNRETADLWLMVKDLTQAVRELAKRNDPLAAEKIEAEGACYCEACGHEPGPGINLERDADTGVSLGIRCSCACHLEPLDYCAVLGACGDCPGYGGSCTCTCHATDAEAETAYRQARAEGFHAGVFGEW